MTHLQDVTARAVPKTYRDAGKTNSAPGVSWIGKSFDDVQGPSPTRP